MQENQVYIYKFADGINYFKGPNDSGKTEFYTFLDYMFGASEDLQNKEWYRDTLNYAKLKFNNNELTFIATRYLSDSNKNYFQYADEPEGDPIRSDEYKSRLSAVFTPNQETLRELRTFVEEDIGYRTFTIFNFLGEKRQGVLQDFFDKSDKIEYALKLPSVLNYIFNKNLPRIEELKRREELLKSQLEKLEKSSVQNENIRERINHQLIILGIKKVFRGSNGEDILQAISKFQAELEKTEAATKSRTIGELEAVYTSLDEQIKKQSNAEYDHKAFEENSQKQKELLLELEKMLDSQAAYSYLVQPIKKLTADLNRSISFNKYLIQENATKELKKQRAKVKDQILLSKSRFAIYTASEKTRAITLIKEYLENYNADFNGEKINDVKRELKDIRQEIRILQNSNDTRKIQDLSDDITRLYKLSTEVSALAEFDFRKNGFHIAYIKNGNILQPQILEGEGDSGEQGKNYYTGSMARHTLIQLCGYLAFLRMLVIENKYPIIPILVIDHISKPFDEKNENAIGKVLHGAYDGLSLSDFQIIMFDDEDASNLDVQPNMITSLVGEGKSGFNPFYYEPPKVTTEDDD